MTAIVIPSLEQAEKFRDPLTPGEIALARHLSKHLPEHWEIYLQPFLNGTRPDIVLFNPGVGVMIIEVKDWHLSNYRFAKAEDNQLRFQVRDSSGQYHTKKNPIYQVEYYRQTILGQLMPDMGELVDGDEKALGLIKIGLYFHNATSVEAQNLFAESPHPHVPIVGNDILHSAQLNNLVADVERTSSHYWRPCWNDEVRSWLKPPFHSAEQATDFELTEAQKRHALPNPGHFRLRGVAGSGKTQVIAYRAASLASKGHDVLIITFNITLWHYIRDMVARAPFSFSWEHITFNHFHGFCKDVLNENEIEWPEGEGKDFFVNVVPDAVARTIETAEKQRKYDAVFIDEGQDFHLKWYQLLSKYLGERDELLLVCDKKQNIYGVNLGWVDASMKGTKFRGDWRKLTTVFRLPSMIARAVERFSDTFNLNQEIKIEAVTQLTLFGHTPDPHIVWINIPSQDYLSWIDKAFNKINKRSHISDIVVLVHDHKTGLKCVEHFTQRPRPIRVNHVFEDGTGSKRHKKSFWMGDGRLKISTIHSFKGWEVLNVIIYIPEMHTENSSSMDSIVYTALTRTRENVIVLNANDRYKNYGKTLPDRWARQTG